jgi:hypothetical protein
MSDRKKKAINLGALHDYDDLRITELQRKVANLEADDARQHEVNESLEQKDASQDGVIANIDSRLETVEELAEISVGGGDIQIATAADFDSDTPASRAKVPTVGAVKDYTDDVPKAGSKKFAESGGVYADTHLCNIPNVNDFVVDIVLKEGVDDPESANYIDFSRYTRIWVGDMYGDNRTIGISLKDPNEEEWLRLFRKTYDSDEAALAAFGTLMESDYCYIVVRHSGLAGGQHTSDGPITFNRDVMWKSLNAHPVIKELLIERETEIIEPKAEHGESAYNTLHNSQQEEIILSEGFWRITNVPPKYRGTQPAFVCNRDNIDCVPGDKFILTGKGSTSLYDGIPKSKLWAFTNAAGEITRSAEVGEVHTTPFELTAQDGEVFFYMTAYANAQKHPAASLSKTTVAGGGLIGQVVELQEKVSIINSEIDEVKNNWEAVSKMFNVPVNLKKPNLKVLDLGNSYTQDSIHYLEELLTAANITTGFSLYRCTRGASSFRTWVNLYKEVDTSTYTVGKVVGDAIPGINTGTGNPGDDNSWFVELLKNDWDIILIHQVSNFSDEYESWTGDGVAGGLTEYLRILKTYCPQASIGFYLVHSYPSWKESPYQEGDDSTERWKNIAKGVKWIKANYAIDFIMPYGTAVQNLRMTSINYTDPVDNTKKNDFSYDGKHLTSGIGDYVAACAYFEALFAPRYEVTVLGNTYTDTNIPVPQPGDSGYYDGRGVPVQITAANALLAQRAAVLAVNDMFNLSNPEMEGFIPSNTDTRHVYNGTGNPSDTYSKEEIDAIIKEIINS